MSGTNQKAAIIGGGVIGGGWAARFLLNGWDVAVYDPAPDAGKKINDVISNARRSLPALYEGRMAEEGVLTFCASIAETVAGAGWIQESVPERLDVKHAVMSEIHTACEKGAVIASSTSGYKPSDLNSAGVGQRAIVAHPFNPVYLLPVVELVGDADKTTQASEILKSIGMLPLIVRNEIDGHIADRLLEAVWREALWLVKDDIATTQEIDDVIRFGFGLRWAQMGLFETYRIAGGTAGMAHFIAQFGPCLQLPWTKLMEVPVLDDELIAKIAAQSDKQSGHHDIRTLERIRDDNLVAIMRALKGRGWGAGAHLNALEKERAPHTQVDMTQPVTTVNRVIPVDWTDYNGHMNESRYGQVFSDAADFMMAQIGADEAYIANGNSFFTVENNIRYRAETRAGQAVKCQTQVILAEGKKLRLFHQMLDEKGAVLALCDQLLIHVSLTTRRACPPQPHVAAKMKAWHTLQHELPLPDGIVR